MFASSSREFAAFVDGCVATFPGGHEPIPQADIDATFAYIDTDSSGGIDFDEFEPVFMAPADTRKL